MTLASYLLFGNCETVLTVDLAWPAYQEIFKQVADKLGRRVVHLEVREIIDAEHRRANQILTEQREKLDLIARRLLEVETLEAEEFVALIEGTEPPAPSTPNAPASRPPVSEPNPRPERKRPSLDLPAPSPA